MRKDEQFQPVAGILAYLLPGLGYLWFGEVRRGILVFSGVMGLVVLGILIGGIDVIDRIEDIWWFALQAGVGSVVWGLDFLHQQLRSGPGELIVTRSLSKVNEVGSLYVAMAGMVNAIAVVDCFWHSPRGRRDQRRDQRRTPRNTPRNTPRPTPGAAS